MSTQHIKQNDGFHHNYGFYNVLSSQEVEPSICLLVNSQTPDFQIHFQEFIIYEWKDFIYDLLGHYLSLLLRTPWCFFEKGYSLL